VQLTPCSLWSRPTEVVPEGCGRSPTVGGAGVSAVAIVSVDKLNRSARGQHEIPAQGEVVTSRSRRETNP
jgi:hypothetical protein